MKTNELVTIIAQKLMGYDSRITLESKRAEKLQPIVGVISIAAAGSSHSYKLRYTFSVQLQDRDTGRLYDKTDEAIAILNKYPISDGNLGFLGATFTTLSDTLISELTFAIEISQLPTAIQDILGRDAITTIDVLLNENCPT